MISYVTGRGISEHELDQLWTISRDIPAERSAAVISELVREKGTDIESSNPEDEESFCQALDALLSSHLVSADQLSTITTKAKLLSGSSLVNVLQKQLRSHWEKKEARKVGRTLVLSGKKRSLKNY